MPKLTFSEAFVLFETALGCTLVGLACFTGVGVALFKPDFSWALGFLLFAALVLVGLGIGLLIGLRLGRILGRQGIGFALMLDGVLAICVSLVFLLSLLHVQEMMLWLGAGGVALLLIGVLLWRVPPDGPIEDPALLSIIGAVKRVCFFLTPGWILAAPVIDLRAPSSGTYSGFMGVIFIGLLLLTWQLLPEHPELFANRLSALPKTKADRWWVLGYTGLLTCDTVLAAYVGLQFGWTPGRVVNLSVLLLLLFLQGRALIIGWHRVARG